MTATPSRAKRWLFRFLAVSLSCLVGGVACELLLRAFVEQETKRLASFDRELGWRGRPNGSGIYIRKADNIRVPFRYNNLGFRDNDVVTKSDQRRVMLLGDSFIENLEVPFPETFPALLEKRLGEHDPTWDTVVIGSQGYSTAQELIAYRKFKDQVDPEQVILFFYCGNDFEDNLRRSFAYLDDAGALQVPPNHDPGWKIQARIFQRWLYESSHLVFLLKNKLQEVAQVEIAPAAKDAVAADEDYQRKITSLLIEKLNAEVTEEGGRFAVVVIPSRNDFREHDATRATFIVDTCQQMHIPVLDLSPYLQISHYFETDVHFNISGHRAVSEAVAEFLLAPQLAN